MMLSVPSPTTPPTFRMGDVYDGLAVSYWKPVPGEYLGLIDSYQHPRDTNRPLPDFMDSARRIAEVVRISPVLTSIYRHLGIEVQQAIEKTGYMHTVVRFPHTTDFITRYNHLSVAAGGRAGRYTEYTGGLYPAETYLGRLAEHGQFLLASDANSTELSHDILVHASTTLTLPDQAVDMIQAYATAAPDRKDNPDVCMFGLDLNLSTVELGKVIARATTIEATTQRSRMWEYVAQQIGAIVELDAPPSPELATACEQRIRSLHDAVQTPFTDAQ